MKEQLKIGLIVAFVGVAAVGYFAFDRWVTRTGGRSTTDLAVADSCVDWAHGDEAARARADAETVAKCQIYFRNRTASDASGDDDRWHQRNGK